MDKGLFSILKKEVEVANQLEDFVDEVCDAVLHADPVNGVTVPKDSGIRCAIVDLSAVRQAKQMCISPEYYIPESQADIVRRKLSSAKTVTMAVSRMAAMVADGYAMLNNTKYPLNPHTVAVLETYL